MISFSHYYHLVTTYLSLSERLCGQVLQALFFSFFFSNSSTSSACLAATLPKTCMETMYISIHQLHPTFFERPSACLVSAVAATLPKTCMETMWLRPDGPPTHSSSPGARRRPQCGHFGWSRSSACCAGRGLM